ncbi:MAG: MFS transporter, partial [Halobacteriaceae archaeon]
MSDSEERLVRGYNGRLLVAISIGWMAIQAGRLAIGPLVPTIKTSLDISSTQVGFAITVIWGLYAILQYPSGRLSDNLTRKTLLVVGLVSLSGGFVLLASATTYGVFLVGAVVIGAGAGLYPTAARALVSDLYVRKRGAAYGIHTASGDLGGVIAAGLAAVVVGAVAWQFTFVPVILSLLSVAAVLHVFSREAYEFSWVDLEIKTTLRRLLTSIQFRWLLVGYSLYAFTWQATTGFLPAYLE